MPQVVQVRIQCNSFRAVTKLIVKYSEYKYYLYYYYAYQNLLQCTRPITPGMTLCCTSTTRLQAHVTYCEFETPMSKYCAMKMAYAHGIMT